MTDLRNTLELVRDSLSLTVVDFENKHGLRHPLTEQGALMLKSRVIEALELLDWIRVDSGRIPEPDPAQEGDMSLQVLLYVPEYEGQLNMDPVVTGYYFFRSKRFRASGGLNGVVTHWRHKPAPPSDLGGKKQP